MKRKKKRMHCTLLLTLLTCSCLMVYSSVRRRSPVRQHFTSQSHVQVRRLRRRHRLTHYSAPCQPAQRPQLQPLKQRRKLVQLRAKQRHLLWHLLALVHRCICATAAVYLHLISRKRSMMMQQRQLEVPPRRHQLHMPKVRCLRGARTAWLFRCFVTSGMRPHGCPTKTCSAASHCTVPSSSR